MDLVTVDAVVRGRRGNIVGGFQAEDFVVYDDGVARQVTHFFRHQLPLAIALVIDRSPSVAASFGEPRGAALRALDRLKPQDQVVLFAFDQYTSPLSDLTQDHARIAAQIGTLWKRNCTRA